MVVSSRCLEAIASLPVLSTAKQPVPYVDFSMPGVEARLSDGRRLLIAGHAANGNRGAEQLRLGGAELRRVVAQLGKQRARHAENVEQLVVPAAGANIEQAGARRVGHVGRVHATARQAPQQKAVDGAEGELAALGALARAGDVIEDPGDLGR